MKEKVVLGLSGGLDSSTVLAHLISQSKDVYCFIFLYGSKHNFYENQAAIKVAEYYDVSYKIIDLSDTFAGFKSNLLKTGGDIPEGHYTDESMSQTVVPGRNIIFLSILAGYAWTIGASKIALGIHQGDHAIYSDCRKEFYKAMDTAIYLGTDNRVEFIAPYIETDKAGIVKEGISLQVPYHLTRTCYTDQPLACGKCGSCVERKEAFEKNNISDSILYKF